MSLLNKAKAENSEEASLARQLSAAERKLAAEQNKSRRLNEELKKLSDENLAINERMDLLLETSGKIQQSKLHKSTKKQSKSPATAILCASDWHAEERIDADTVGGLNEFNLDIADRRIKRLWEKTVYLKNFSQHIADVDDLVLWLGGDLISNVLHQETAESNFLGPTSAILWVQQRIAEGINFLLPHFQRIHVVTSIGNHSRTTKKTHIATAYRHSWEYLAYCNLKTFFAKEQKTTWQVERGYHSWVNIQDHDVRFHHGDAIRYSGAIGGWSLPVKKKLAQWNKAKRADLDIQGHAHQFVHDWNFVINGCLVGYNTFAQWIGAEFQPATQTFLIMDKDYGNVMTVPIFVEQAKSKLDRKSKS